MHGVCLVGCGTIARMHAGNLKQRVDLYFHSRTPSSAERLCEEFGGRGVIATFDEVVEHADVDALLVATPPEHHTEQIARGLEVGKCVLVEKPMCAAPEEIARLEEVLQSHPDAFLMVAENYYYKPSLVLLKELIGQGLIGAVEAVDVKKCFTQETAGWKEAYGALLEGGIHFVALISGLFDAAPTRVSAEFPGRQNGQSERHSIVSLEYEGGATAELRYAWDVPSLTKGTFQHSHINGSEGKITFESNGIYVRLKSSRKKKLYFPNLKDLMGYKAMTQDFIACLEDRSRVPHSDFAKAKRDLNIVFNAYNRV